MRIYVMPGSGPPWPDFGIPAGLREPRPRRHQIIDFRHFPGSGPPWPDFGIPAGLRERWPRRHQIVDFGHFPGSGPPWPDFGIPAGLREWFYGVGDGASEQPEPCIFTVFLRIRLIECMHFYSVPAHPSYSMYAFLQCSKPAHKNAYFLPPRLGICQYKCVLFATPTRDASIQMRDEVTRVKERRAIIYAFLCVS